MYTLVIHPEVGNVHPEVPRWVWYTLRYLGRYGTPWYILVDTSLYAPWYTLVDTSHICTLYTLG